MPPFHTTYSKLTPAQHEAIGRVAVNWSLVEFAIETILARLVCAPDFPALALTNDLSIDNRLNAMHNLIAIHRSRYASRIIPDDVLDELAALRPEIANKKNERNKIVHLVWFRSNDSEMFGIKFKGKPPLDMPEKRSQMTSTVVGINAFADELERLADHLFELMQRMPEIAEASLCKSGRP